MRRLLAAISASSFRVRQSSASINVAGSLSESRPLFRLTFVLLRVSFVTLRVPIFLILCVLCVLCSESSVTYAGDYPSKPIRIIVPYPPGGFNDTLAHTLGQKLNEKCALRFKQGFRTRRPCRQHTEPARRESGVTGELRKGADRACQIEAWSAYCRRIRRARLRCLGLVRRRGSRRNAATGHRKTQWGDQRHSQAARGQAVLQQPGSRDGRPRSSRVCRFHCRADDEEGEGRRGFGDESGMSLQSIETA